jgi:hypothetical protein
MKTGTAMSFFLASLYLWVSPSDAQEAVEHRLKFAVRPGIAFTEADADAIINKMNNDFANPTSLWADWDVPCSAVRFTREGKVLKPSGLPSVGEFEDLKSSLLKLAPDANVFVVTNLICAGRAASGCSLTGSEPAIVTALWGLETDAVVIMHERGHDMGLNHATDRPEGYDGESASTAPVSVGHRIMFWQPDKDHTGKTSDECKTFAQPRFASIDLPAAAELAAAQSSTPSVNAASTPKLAAADLPPGEAASRDTRKGNAGEASPEKGANKYGLTSPAFQLLNQPYDDTGSFAASVKKLSESDLDSIRNFVGNVKFGPSAMRLKALTILGEVGKQVDVSLMQGILNQPVAAALPGETTFEQREQMRIAVAEKNAAIESLGSLAKSTDSTAALKTLKKNVDVFQASSTIGKENAEALSQNSLRALANSPKGADFVSKILDATKDSPAKWDKPQKVKPSGETAVVVPPLPGSFRDQLQSNIKLQPTAT